MSGDKFGSALFGLLATVLALFALGFLVLLAVDLSLDLRHRERLRDAELHGCPP